MFFEIDNISKKEYFIREESIIFTIEFYRMESGKCPVEEFMDALPIKLRVKAIDSLQILEEMGTTLRSPYSKYIRDGIMELRIKFSSDIVRIFYFFQKEIQLACKYKADYERRHYHE